MSLPNASYRDVTNDTSVNLHTNFWLKNSNPGSGAGGKNKGRPLNTHCSAVREHGAELGVIDVDGGSTTAAAQPSSGEIEERVICGSAYVNTNAPLA